MAADHHTAIAAQRSAYGANFQIHGDGPRATLQTDQISQFLRFERLLKEIRPYCDEGVTIHDLGSGICDFYAFLRQQGLQDTVQYSGTEIVEEMNALARQKYPQLTLLNRDILEAPAPDDHYDFCIASGTFNLLGGLEEGAWRSLCYDLMKAMFLRAKKGIAFNILTSYRTFSDPMLCYFDPREVFDFLTTNMSRFIVMDASAPLYEVTFTVFKKEFVAANHPQPELAKYFR